MTPTKNKIILSLGMVVLANTASAQVAPTANVMRSQELIQDNKPLMDELNKTNRSLVRKVIVRGFLLKDVSRIYKGLKPFQNKWLDDNQVQEAVDVVKAFYVEAGYERMVTFQPTINRKILTITVSLTH